MAAAAGAGTALLRSVATKMGMAIAPRAPSSLHRHPLFLPGLRGRRPGPTSSRHHSSSSSAPSGSTPPPPPPPPTNSKEFTQNKNVLGKLNSAKAAPVRKLAIMASFVMFGTGCFPLFWVMPRFEALSDKVRVLRRQRLILIKALEECQSTHINAQDVLDKNLQVLEQVKVSDGQQALDD